MDHLLAIFHKHFIQGLETFRRISEFFLIHQTLDTMVGNIYNDEIIIYMHTLTIHDRAHVSFTLIYFCSFGNFCYLHVTPLAPPVLRHVLGKRLSYSLVWGKKKNSKDD